MVYFQSLTQLFNTLGSDYKQDKEVMVGSSKLKNLPHCSNLKVRHKAPKTTKYVPLNPLAGLKS